MPFLLSLTGLPLSADLAAGPWPVRLHCYMVSHMFAVCFVPLETISHVSIATEPFNQHFTSRISARVRGDFWYFRTLLKRYSAKNNIN